MTNRDFLSTYKCIDEILCSTHKDKLNTDTLDNFSDLFIRMTPHFEELKKDEVTRRNVMRQHLQGKDEKTIEGEMIIEKFNEKHQEFLEEKSPDFEIPKASKDVFNIIGKHLTGAGIIALKKYLIKE